MKPAAVRLFGFQSADVFALFKVEGVFLPIPSNHRIKIAGGILGGTGAETIETQGVFIVLPFIVAVFAAGIELAEYQLPVIPLLRRVPIHRTAAAKVLHLNGVVEITGH